MTGHTEKPSTRAERAVVCGRFPCSFAPVLPFPGRSGTARPGGRSRFPAGDSPAALGPSSASHRPWLRARHQWGWRQRGGHGAVTGQPRGREPGGGDTAGSSRSVLVAPFPGLFLGRVTGKRCHTGRVSETQRLVSVPLLRDVRFLLRAPKPARVVASRATAACPVFGSAVLVPLAVRAVSGPS